MDHKSPDACRVCWIAQTCMRRSRLPTRLPSAHGVHELRCSMCWGVGPSRRAVAARHTRAREEIGLDNIVVMIPFCRTLEEADNVLEVLAENGLMRGKNGLDVYVMVEIPSNVLLAEKFAERFDGFSIGSNDLTQLILGVDRDSSLLSGLFDEQNEAVKAAIGDLLSKARKSGIPTGLCGQAPSDHPEFAAFLVSQGITSISVSPDSFLAVKEVVARTEAESGRPESTL